MMRKAIILFFGICVLAAGVPAAKADSPRRMTVMIYMCGSNLESSYGSATSDMMEMLAAGVDGTSVSVLVMAGGTSCWGTGFSADELSICEISSRGMRIVSHENARSMGSAETLTQLIDFSVENYPAEHYALIFWDHGGGPLDGVCWDELFSMENLTLAEVTRALRNSKLPGKLEFVGFDACLMGSVEVAGALAPYARYMIASQETEPAAGWNYAFLRDIGNAGDGAEMGRLIVDAYFDSLADSKELLTLSCIDLSKIEALETAMDIHFSDMSVSMDRTTFNHFSSQRSSAGDFGSPVRSSGDEGYDLTDLKALAEQEDGGEVILDALAEAVVYSRSSTAYGNGLSVYHPYLNKSKYISQWKDSYKALNFCPGYTRYIRRFAEMLISESDINWELPEPVAAETGREMHFSLTLTDEQTDNFISARLLVLREIIAPNKWSGTGITLVWSEASVLADDNTLSADYGWEQIYLVNEEDRILTGPVSYIPDTDGTTFILPALYWNYSDDAVPMENVRHYGVRADSSDEIRFERIYVYDEMVEAYTNRIRFSDDLYEGVYFWRPIVNLPPREGRIPGFSDWEMHPGASMPGFELPVSWHGRIVRERSSGAWLYAAFEITDTQQNTHCSPLIRLDDPLIIPLEVQTEMPERDDLRFEGSATLFASQMDPRIELFLTVENLSGMVYRIESDHMVSNGNWETEEYLYYGEVNPGERSLTNCVLKGTAENSVDSVEDVACTILLYGPDDYFTPVDSFNLVLHLKRTQ